MVRAHYILEEKLYGLNEILFSSFRSKARQGGIRRARARESESNLDDS